MSIEEHWCPHGRPYAVCLLCEPLPATETPLYKRWKADPQFHVIEPLSMGGTVNEEKVRAARAALNPAIDMDDYPEPTAFTADPDTLITNTLSAYELGYARGKLDAVKLVRAWSDEQTTMDACKMTNDLEALLAKLESEANPHE